MYEKNHLISVTNFITHFILKNSAFIVGGVSVFSDLQLQNIADPCSKYH